MDSGKRPGKSGRARKNHPAPPTQERAIQTRDELLNAARLIFARDGFEVATLQDIATAAGKTRGALYVHFKDKEDLFFALIAQYLMQDTAAYRRKLHPSSSREEQIVVLTAQLEALVHNRQRALLSLEFKLYAARRPRKQKRLAELHAAMCEQGTAQKMELMPELKIEDPKEHRRVLASFGALLDGLALNLYFDPVGLTDEVIHSNIERSVRERFGS